MGRKARFWRNVAFIALVHVGGLIALLRWAGASKIESAPEITWLSTDTDTSVTVDSPKREETPIQAEGKTAPPEQNQSTPSPPVNSEIQLPAVTPHPIPTPSATAKPSPNATPKPSRKKKTSTKSSVSPEKKKSKAQSASPKEEENAKNLALKKGQTKNSQEKSGPKTAKNGNAAADGTQTNAGSASENAGWYGDMLHDRFYREWAQPTTVVASGANLFALARIRIEKDGRISDFKIVRSSGNVLIDESVEAVGKKVTRVDALPAGIGSGEHYDVNINFALNSK